MIDKIFPSADEAVAAVKDGDVVPPGGIDRTTSTPGVPIRGRVAA